MSIDFRMSIVYILDEGSLQHVGNRTAGTGFVVTSDGLITTCAHVINFARASEFVHLIFYDPTTLKAQREIRVARVLPEYVRDANTEDIAILRLEVPLPLRQSFNTQGQTFLSFGFPEAKPEDGLLGECRVLGPVSADTIPLIQLTSDQVASGFSGAPVWDEKHQAVIGMITSIIGTRKVKIAGTAIELPFDRDWRNTGVTFATPVETLREVCPHLQISDVCPYCGLVAFTEEQAQFFFGREYLIGRLLNRLRQDLRFLAVLGPSGSGKSSVVQAGLIPQLRQGAIKDSDRWGMIATRPAADPFKQLATAGLLVESQNLTEGVRSWLAQHAQQTRLVLVIDQFEELLTACSESARRDFVGQLTALLGSDLPITVILVMRDDFYNQLAQQEALVEWLERSQGPMNIPQALKWDEVMTIVQKPAEAVGLRFQEGLVEAIVNDATGTATSSVEGGRTARITILPLLEFALTQLWEKRKDGILSREAYEAIGKVTGGLTQWADQVLSRLKVQEEQWEEKQRNERQKLARRIFTDLVYIGDESQGIPDSRRRVALAALCRQESELAEVRQVVQQLTDGHLLVTTYDAQSKEETVEIIHDALLWEWGELRRWLRDDHDFLVWHQEFERRVQAWVETNSADPAGREEDKLFGGSDLAEAIEWLITRRADLAQTEQDFIQASQVRQAQEEGMRKRYEEAVKARRRLLITSVLGGIAVSGGAGWFAVQWLASVIPTYINVSTYTGHKMPVWRVAWSRDASRIASVGPDRTAQVWSANTGRPIYTYARRKGAVAGHTDSVTAVTWSLDSYYVASASYDKTVQVWNSDGQVNLYKPLTYRRHTNLVLAVAWSPDGKYIASAGYDRIVHVWQPVSLQTIYTYQGHSDSVNAVAWSPGSQRIASGSGDRTVRVWDATSGKHVLTYTGHNNHVVSVAWSPNGKYIASAGWDTDHRVQVWEAATGKTVYTYAGRHKDVVTAVSWSPDSAYIASGSWDGTVQVWNALNGNVICDYLEHHAKVLSAVWSPRDRRIASAGYDKVVRVWQPK